MPLATHPNVTYKVVLSSDSGLPENEQPVFIFRYLSILEWEDVATLDDKFHECNNSIEMVSLAIEVIQKALYSWENMVDPATDQEIPYDPAKLKSILSMPEVTELMQAAVAQNPTVADKKKLDSPSVSSTKLSAKTARGRKRAKKNRRK